MTERDYVLGTHDDEVERLSLQHQVWRPIVLETWRQAGVARGHRVLDVGCGPGYATTDLAELVGPQGSVLGVERSERFANIARARAAGLGHRNIDVQLLDLMMDELPIAEFDAVWCRWVGIFVSSPATLVAKIARALKPGGVAIFHEYYDYGTWRVAPSKPALEEFTETVMRNWRGTGGDPNVARQLPCLLAENDMQIVAATPRLFCVRPGELRWQWPATFVRVNLARILELGQIDQAFADRANAEFNAAEQDSNTVLITPLVLEVVARH
ncbi:MAG: methyltransferase domain-containing protein [Myxococcales bacterium]|nr:methyltransferase domain-containing protein [Myxococcales bacterium]